MTILPVGPAPLVLVRRAVIFFLLEESPVHQGSADGQHCYDKFFVCDLRVDKVVKEKPDRVFYAIEDEVPYRNDGGAHYEEDAHCRHPVPAAAAACLLFPPHQIYLCMTAVSLITFALSSDQLDARVLHLVPFRCVQEHRGQYLRLVRERKRTEVDRTQARNFRCQTRQLCDGVLVVATDKRVRVKALPDVFQLDLGYSVERRNHS